MTVEELLTKVDIVEIASRYLDLEQRGEEFWSISPLTYPPEKTPSFSIRRETNRFYDFSSGQGGGCIKFLQLVAGMTTQQAIDELKRYAGVSDEIAVSYRDKIKCVIVAPVANN